MNKYRRIEINAYRRRVTVLSGEWRPGDLFEAEVDATADEISLNDTDSCVPVETDSPEGQLILVEAVRSLERRLSPEARAAIHAEQDLLAPTRLDRNRFFHKLRSTFRSLPRFVGFARKEKRPRGITAQEER